MHGGIKVMHFQVTWADRFTKAWTDYTEQNKLADAPGSSSGSSSCATAAGQSQLQALAESDHMKPAVLRVAKNVHLEAAPDAASEAEAGAEAEDDEDDDGDDEEWDADDDEAEDGDGSPEGDDGDPAPKKEQTQAAKDLAAARKICKSAKDAVSDTDHLMRTMDEDDEWDWAEKPRKDLEALKDRLGEENRKTKLSIMILSGLKNAKASNRRDGNDEGMGDRSHDT
eukprot:942535-Pyramimonas_sp.AAC.1